MRWGCGALHTVQGHQILPRGITSNTDSYARQDLSPFATAPQLETTFSITAEPKPSLHPVRAASAHTAPTAVSADSSVLGVSSHGEQDDRQPSPVSQGLSETQLQHNAALISRLQGKLILAPLTKYVSVNSCAHAMNLSCMYSSGFWLLLSKICAEVCAGEAMYRSGDYVPLLVLMPQCQR